MSTYRRYQDARDAAWRALLRLKVGALPVDAVALARQLGMEALPFPLPQEEPRLAELAARAGRGVCVSLRVRGVWHLFFRDGLSEDQRRFAAAHELGHRLLEHETRSLAPGVRAYVSLDNAGDLMEDPDDLDDYAADIFAIRLLAPACVLHEMHVDQSGRIASLCGLPPRAAALRAERMQLLNRRDAYFTHPLERQVRNQFLPFIRAANGWPAAGAGTGRAPAVMAPLPSREKEESPGAPLPGGGALPDAAPAGPPRRRWGWRAVCLGLAGALALVVFFLAIR